MLGHNTLEDALRTHPFLSRLPENHVAPFAAFAAITTFETDEVVIEDRHSAQACYLLVEGSVAVELATPRLTVCVQTLHSGDMFGWSAFLEHQDTVFRIRAREHTTAIRLDGAKLAEVCNRHPDVAAELLRRTLRVVAGRVKATEAAFAQFCGVKV
jgi:CRP-like cAMP-binding protein